jgi:hypothetical protein
MADKHERVDENTQGGELGAGGGGSNDVTSGGGAGAGIPDAETAMRLGDVVTRGDPDRDRQRIFPEASNDARQAVDSHDDMPSKDEGTGL